MSKHTKYRIWRKLRDEWYKVHRYYKKTRSESRSRDFFGLICKILCGVLFIAEAVLFTMLNIWEAIVGVPTQTPEHSAPSAAATVEPGSSAAVSEEVSPPVTAETSETIDKAETVEASHEEEASEVICFDLSALRAAEAMIFPPLFSEEVIARASYNELKRMRMFSRDTSDSIYKMKESLLPGYVSTKEYLRKAADRNDPFMLSKEDLDAILDLRERYRTTIQKYYDLVCLWNHQTTMLKELINAQKEENRLIS